MTCPKCGQATKLVRTMQDEENNTTIRYRKCGWCEYKFKTLEVAVKKVQKQSKKM